MRISGLGRRWIALAAFTVLLGSPALAAAQAMDGTGIVATGLLLRRIDGVKRVLMIGAHPDDEDTSLLTTLARGWGAETAYLSLTRGDGGQNLIGAELWEGLGVVRTGELEAARALDGGEQYFTRAFDYGLLATGALPRSWLRVPAAHRSDPVVASPRDSDDACACDPGAAPPAAAPPAAAPAELRRVSVCPREESPPTLSVLAGRADRAPRFAVHCGSSVHIIAFDRAAPGLAPRRVLRLDAQGPNAGLAALSGSLLGGDLDADSVADVIVAQRWLGGASAHTGALYLLRGLASGGLAAPRRILDVVAPALTFADLGDATVSLALLMQQDARVDQPDELWLVAGGPSPLRTARQSVRDAASQVLAVDLDGDGGDELLLLFPDSERVEVHRAVGGEADAKPEELKVPGLREGALADLDGDGDRDLLLVGEEVWVRYAGKDEPAAPRALFRGDKVRGISAQDTNADGKLDLVGYAHPAIISFEREASSAARDAAFHRRELTRLAGDQLAVVEARIASLDSAPGLDLVLLAIASDADGQVELALASGFVREPTLRLAAHSAPLADAPLVQSFPLR